MPRKQFISRHARHARYVLTVSEHAPRSLTEALWRTTSRNVKRTQENFSPEVSKIGVSEPLMSAFAHCALHCTALHCTSQSEVRSYFQLDSVVNAQCGKAVFKDEKYPNLDTLGKKFSWIHLTFLEVVLHRASVGDLSAWCDLVRTYLACLACLQINCFWGILYLWF